MSDPKTGAKRSWAERLSTPAVRYSARAFRRRALLQPLSNELVIQAALEFHTGNNVPGDYLEFGVFQGRSLMHAYFYNRYLVALFDSKTVPLLRGASCESARNARFFAFDSFEGLPEPAPHDVQADQPDWFVKGGFSCSQAEFEQNLVANGVDLSRIEIVPGWYADTLHSQTKRARNLTTAAVVHIDCDYYDSTVQVLDFVTDLLVDGSVIVFDDWFVYRARPDMGQQRAFREWLERNPTIRAAEYVKLSTMSFLIHRVGA